MVATVRKLAAAGLSFGEICTHVEMSQTGLWDLKKREGILVQPQRLNALSEADESHIVAMAKQGATQTEIGAAVGIDQTTVSRYFARLGIKTRLGRQAWQPTATTKD